jgi:hypothetical protein
LTSFSSSDNASETCSVSKSNIPDLENMVRNK